MRSSAKLAARQPWQPWLGSTTRSDLPPLFLCPILQYGHLPKTSTSNSSTLRSRWPGLPKAPRRWHSGTASASASLYTTPAAHRLPTVLRQLPSSCPGCGSLAQSFDDRRPGFYDTNRAAVRRYLGGEEEIVMRPQTEDDIVRESLQKALEESPDLVDPKLQSLLADDQPAVSASSEAAEPAILCERCHNLLHHKAGNPIFHPTIEAVADTLDESPYKHNHVYHVLDAADFPMSLLPKIHSLLDLSPLRSKNRRAAHVKYSRNRLTTMSFVITRSDLFAPRKEQVDRLMPWITETLRDALGRSARDARLGNIFCVSGKKNWWTSELKEDVWKRGGATWMVGKANVGKSYLFQHVFPKGRMAWGKSITEPAGKTTDPFAAMAAANRQERQPNLKEDRRFKHAEENVMLPPVRPETEYPAMPVASALPGTTASPIRLSFGDGRGELIDMPGLPRTNIADYVKPEHHESLVMQTRITPRQVVLKGHWDSLLIGGFIRITPRTKDLTFMTYNFTPLKEHRTFTEKAKAIQEQTATLNVENIALPGVGEKMKLAGSFELKYDVTKARSGPLTRKDDVGLRVDVLPFRVFSIDILIEGVGWVEVTAQCRARHMLPQLPAAKDLLQEAERGENPSRPRGGINYPVIDVYSPEGKCISSRRPLNGWLLCRPKADKSQRMRPKRSMKGAKKAKKKKVPQLTSFRNPSPSYLG